MIFILVLSGTVITAATAIFLYSDVQNLVFSSDAFYYLLLRDRVLSGDILLLASQAAAAPAYPWFLSIIASIFGQEMTWIYTAQIILTALTALMIYRLAYKIAGPKPARIALLGYVLYFPLLIIGLEIHPQILFLFLVMLTTNLLFEATAKDKTQFYAGAGIAAGLTVLTRSVALYLPFALLAALLLKQPRNWRKHFIFILTFVAVLTPWVIRNSANLNGSFSVGNYTIVNQFEEITIPAQVVNAIANSNEGPNLNWSGLLKSFAYPYRLSFIYAYGGTPPVYHYRNILKSPDLAALAKFISQPKIIFTAILYFIHALFIALFSFYTLNLLKRIKKADIQEVMLLVSFLYFAASILFVSRACDICYSYYLVPAIPFILILAAIGLNNILNTRNAPKN